MKQTFLKTLSALALLAMFASCGSDGVGVPHDDSYTDQQSRDTKALEERYSHAIGTYEGTLVPTVAGLPTYPGRLEIMVRNLDAGSNPDGSRRTQAVLVGRFRLTNVVSSTDYTVMVATYNVGSGSITLSGSGSASSPTAADANAITLSGTVGGDAADVMVRKSSGDWGRFSGHRVSTDVTSSFSPDDVERRQRLFEIYNKIEGNYSGVVDTGSQRYSLLVTITVKEIPAQQGDAFGGATIPTLIAQYRRLDSLPGIGEYQLAVNYDQLSGRLGMTATAGGSPSIPGSQTLSASGTWINGKLDVTFRDRFGYGDFTATRRPLRD